MPITMSCDCGRAFNVRDEFAGRKIRCPECKSVLTVPAKDADADDLALEVLREDEPEEQPTRRAAIQSEPSPARTPQPRSYEPERESPSIPRRYVDVDAPAKRKQPKLRREDARAPSRF